jgi:quercetin dioxygenase-like cupin family protein
MSMAQVGQQIENPRTGQRMRFLQTAAETDGERARIESWNPPTHEDEPIHVHPRQESRVEVLAGTLRFVVDGREREVGPGESLVIPAGTPHMFGNHSGEEAHSIHEFRPALRIIEFFEYFFDLAARGELNQRGMPSLLELAVSAPAFADEIRVTSPPWPVQRLMFSLLAPLARRRGLTGPRGSQAGRRL